MLLSTSAELLGNLQDWLNYNTAYLGTTNEPTTAFPDLISYILAMATQWLISLAADPQFLTGALAESLENICGKGYRHLHQYFDPLLQIVHRVKTAPIRASEKERASLCLLRG